MDESRPSVHRSLVADSRHPDSRADGAERAAPHRRGLALGPEDDVRKIVRILGTRGIPGGHGGFESFAEDLAPFLAGRGWSVTVYCQEDSGPGLTEDSWNGVRLVRIPIEIKGSLGTVLFDWRSMHHALSEEGLVLVLGYNTAVFNVVDRLRGKRTLLNMDGLEWRRQKYNALERLWFLGNEWIGLRSAHHLIADHPAIEARCRARMRASRITTVPYGSRTVVAANPELLAAWGLEQDRYALLIARPVPENSILEIVRAFSARRSDRPLAVLGAYDRSVPYQRQVLAAAGPDVRFLGPVYERRVVDALRYHAALYVHGHQVGGTNPSLVEALGAGSPVLAHDNCFNRWTCGGAAAFFRDEDDLRAQLDRLLGEGSELERAGLRRLARAHHAATFELQRRLREYEDVLLAMLS